MFTHNIFHVTDQFDVTVGLRYTSERKKLDATFANDNLACVQNQAALAPFLTNTALAATAGGIIGLSCQGNSTAELNGSASGPAQGKPPHRHRGAVVQAQ